MPLYIYHDDDVSYTVHTKYTNEKCKKHTHFCLCLRHTFHGKMFIFLPFLLC